MDTHTENMINNMMTAISQLDLEDFVKNFNESRGFMHSQDKRVIDIGNHELVLADSHSGSSFALTLRHCQAKLREQASITNIDCCCNEEPEPDTMEKVEGIIKIIAMKSQMDDNNKKALEVLETQGLDASIKHMFTGENGQQRSYAEMRALYG